MSYSKFLDFDNIVFIAFKIMLVFVSSFDTRFIYETVKKKKLKHDLVC